MATADDIRIIEETLEKLGLNPGTIDGVMDDHLYTQVQTLLSNLTANDTARTAVLGQINTPAEYSELKGYTLRSLLGLAQAQVANSLESGDPSSRNTVVETLRGLGLTLTPEEFTEFKPAEIDSFFTALNNVSGAGLFNALPSTRDPSLTTAAAVEPAAPAVPITAEEQAERAPSVQAMELFLINTIPQLQTSLGEQIAYQNTIAENDASTAADKAAAQDIVTRLTSEKEALEAALNALTAKRQEINALPEAERSAQERWDATSTQALNLYIMNLQARNGLTRWELPQDGKYSNAFHLHLQSKLADSRARITELESGGITDEEKREHTALQTMVPTLERTTTLLTDLRNSGAIEWAPDPAGAETAQDLPTIPKENALKILETAIQFMVDEGQVHYETNGFGDADFDMETRRATQALLVAMAQDLGIGPSDGRYTEELRLAMEEALQDPAKKDLLKKYFGTDEVMLDNLILALNTAGTSFNDITNQPSNIRTETLIYKPELRGAEINAMLASIERIPSGEDAVINQMAIIMTGYGIEDMMPEGSLNTDQISALGDMGGKTREELFAELFKTAYQEAANEVGSGNQALLQEEIRNILYERFNDVFEDIPAFNTEHRIYFRSNIRTAVEDAFLATNSATGTPIEILDIAAAQFGKSIPSHSAFANEHGPGHRELAIFDQENMETTLPESVMGFAGNIEKLDAPVKLETALKTNTLSAMISDITTSYLENPSSLSSESEQFSGEFTDNRDSDYSSLRSSQAAAKTLAEVELDLVNIEQDIIEAYVEAGLSGTNIITSNNGESFLVTHTSILDGEEPGFTVRYLDAAGIAEVTHEGAPIQEIEMPFSTNMDEILIKTAYATYQARNEQQSNSIESHTPTFFELNGENFVAGIDKSTGLFQVIKMDPELLSPERALILAKAQTREERLEAKTLYAETDPAYRFLRDNYQSVMTVGGYRDYIFSRMAAAVGTPETEQAREIIYHLYTDKAELDPTTIAQVPPIAESGVSEYGLYLVSNAREDATQPFVAFKAVNGTNGEEFKILLVTPGEEGNDLGIQDITDPEVYGRLGETIKDLEIIDLHGEENSVLADFQAWKESGVLPPDSARQVYAEPARMQEPEPETVDAAKHIEKIEFVFDQNTDVAGSLEPGIYISARGIGHDQLNIEMSEEEIELWQNSLGINLDEMYHEQFDGSSPNRFFVVAVDGRYAETLDQPGGFILGYMDDDGNTRFGFVSADEYQVNATRLHKTLSAEYIHLENGHERYHKFPDSEHRHPLPLHMRGLYIREDGSHTGPGQFEDIKADMYDSGWPDYSRQEGGVLKQEFGLKTGAVAPVEDESPSLSKAIAEITGPPYDPIAGQGAQRSALDTASLVSTTPRG